jgi:hypothetical protein
MAPGYLRNTAKQTEWLGQNRFPPDPDLLIGAPLSCRRFWRNRDLGSRATVDDLGIALLGGGCIAGFGSLSSIKLGLCAGSIHDHVKDAG